MSKQSDTIAAICTPCGRSGIGIIRISGNKALEIISKITITKKPINHLFSNNSRKLIHAHLVDDDNIIDEILFAIMPPGHSYTGELTVEINCHGGVELVNTSLDLVLKNGARLANRGEFTKRAVENGRIDIVQAEAINDLIMSSTKIERKIAWRQYEGGLSSLLKELKSDLINITSQNLFLLDFEGEIQERDFINLESSITELKKRMENMLLASKNSHILKQGYWVVLAGPPNSGKSSIFNYMLNISRSIVSEIPGTTRDYIMESLILNGIEIKLIDTAGIRETYNEIEKISIESSKFQMERADLILYIIDQSAKLTYEQKRFALKVIGEDGFVVFNKNDLSSDAGVIKFLEKNSDKNIINVSAKTGFNIDFLIKSIENKAHDKIALSENTIMTSERQNKLLKEAHDSLERISNIKNDEIDLVHYELSSAIKKIDEIFCENSDDDVFENIFRNFCVGK